MVKAEVAFERAFQLFCKIKKINLVFKRFTFVDELRFSVNEGEKIEIKKSKEKTQSKFTRVRTLGIS